ncbi:hypothetical protein BJ878DRAFT_57443 [Calycina marina]|uniref:Uncharacterized protein n=1 Tax=Calycina marina TaxID=1763456 RepID=A0A9P8CFC4_9HELO|nr:hypothetical protein BJ878DRAFT_57443 [Calycina marina]
MPLFSKSEPVTEPVRDNRTGRRVGDPVGEDTTPKRSSTLFGRKNSPEPVAKSSSMFGRKHSPEPAANNTSPHRHGLLHRHEDSSVTSARERLMGAEQAEKDADRALLTARHAVREAKAHLLRLEKEAAEEARLAKIKQKLAGDLGKRGKQLGRKCPSSTRS